MAREPTNGPVHLRPHAPVAERVLLPGDPGRALRLAQELVAEPKMLNHNRGLWGYTGVAPDGEPLTIQSTGIGGPSAAVVVQELIGLGARRLVRVGTCGALAADLALGDLVVADPVLARDGASRALGAGATLAPDAGMTGALSERARATGPVLTTDLFYARAEGGGARAESGGARAEGGGARAQSGGARADADGALAREMEAAAVLAVAAAHGVPAACVLLVAADAAGERLDVEALHAAELELGRAGAAALGAA